MVRKVRKKLMMGLVLPKPKGVSRSIDVIMQLRSGLDIDDKIKKVHFLIN